MRLFLIIVLLLGYTSCSHPQRNLVQFGEANFRISLNYNRDLSDAEIDSLEKSKPTYSQIDKTSKLYKLLVTRGAVLNEELDTTNLHFKLVTWENPIANFEMAQIILDTTGGNDHIILNEGTSELKTTLGPRLLGDIFVSYMDIDSNQSQDLLVLQKYYVMNGYNFDLKVYTRR